MSSLTGCLCASGQTHGGLPPPPKPAAPALKASASQASGSFRARILALADEFEELESRCALLETCKLAFDEDDFLFSTYAEPSASSIGVVRGQSISHTSQGRKLPPDAIQTDIFTSSLSEHFHSEPPPTRTSRESKRASFSEPPDNSEDLMTCVVPRKQDESVPSISVIAPDGASADLEQAPMVTVTRTISSKPLVPTVSEPLSPSPSRARTLSRTRARNGGTPRTGPPGISRIPSLSNNDLGADQHYQTSRLRFDHRFLETLPEEDQTRRHGSEPSYREDVIMTDVIGRQKTPFGLLSPIGTPRLMWDFLASFILMVDVWVTLFEMVYLPFNDEERTFLPMHYVIVAFFVLDIGLNFSTGFIKEDKIVMERWESFVKYSRSWFWVDTLATIPFDLIVQGLWDGSSAVSLIRIAKVARVLRTLRFMRMMRSHRTLQQARSRRQHIYDMLSPCIALFQLVLFGCFLAHVDACLRGLVQLTMNTMERTRNLERAINNYWDNFLWCFLTLAQGDGNFGTSPDEPTEQENEFYRMRAFNLLLASQRLLMLALLGLWAVTTGSRFFTKNDAFRSMKADTLAYLTKRKVSIEMQLQIVYFLNQAHKAQVMQSRFQHFARQHLPEELRRAVCEELWGERLLSIGLILHVVPKHDDLLARLALIVREEVWAGQMVLCREGTQSIAAFNVIKGKFLAIGKFSHFPPWTEGMWVSERALVSTYLHRKMTVVAATMSYTMTVPAEEFHQELAQLDLTRTYQDFCVAHVPAGLCGRCGTIGEHMILNCPSAGKTRQLFRPGTKSRLKTPFLCRFFPNVWQFPPRLYGEKQMRRDRLRMGTQDIRKLAELEQQEILDAATALEDGPAADGHLLFLSHYKAEAGTEASLIRTEIEHIMGEDPYHDANYFDCPIFLDSEDLWNLEDVREKVRQSHNLLLLLSKGVLTRPWVLLEICTAIQSGTRIVPVLLVKHDKFEFPEDRFYAKLMQGGIVGEEGKDLLAQHGYSLEHVKQSLRSVFNKIAMPYSPHQRATIRKAELKAILKLCSLKKERSSSDDKSAASDTPEGDAD